MKDGFIKVAAGTPDVQVADCEFNAAEIIKMVREMEAEGARVMVFPELCITAYTCGDLFWQENLLEEAKVQLMRIAEETADVDAIIFVGLPLEYKGKLYNVAAGLNHGEILGFVPKTYLPNYNEFYEARYLMKWMSRSPQISCSSVRKCRNSRSRLRSARTSGFRILRA